MSIYAIGDLHFGTKVNKPMNIFGEKWYQHEKKISENWSKVVKEEDTVLLCGDISWGMNIDEARPDLNIISELPGKKILIKGNHDFWWLTISKLNKMYNNLFFLQNSCIQVENYAICGTRGWICPNDTKFTKHDNKIYQREINRLELSLKKAQGNNSLEIIVMLHYPPTNDKLEKSGFIELIEKYNVKKVIYGHLHGENSYDCGIKGNHFETNFNLVSADYLDFQLLKL